MHMYMYMNAYTCASELIIHMYVHVCTCMCSILGCTVRHLLRHLRKTRQRHAMYISNPKAATKNYVALPTVQCVLSCLSGSVGRASHLECMRRGSHLSAAFSLEKIVSGLVLCCFVLLSLFLSIWAFMYMYNVMYMHNVMYMLVIIIESETLFLIWYFTGDWSDASWDVCTVQLINVHVHVHSWLCPISRTILTSVFMQYESRSLHLDQFSLRYTCTHTHANAQAHPTRMRTHTHTHTHTHTRTHAHTTLCCGVCLLWYIGVVWEAVLRDSGGGTNRRMWSQQA